MPTDVYVELLRKETSRVLAENPPAGYPVPVAAAWSLAVAQIKQQMPGALDLLRRCAYFGPEPVPLEWLTGGGTFLGPPLRDTLSDQIVFGRAIRELGRYALTRLDNRARSLQVHRLIQALIREDIATSEQREVRHDVHRLLAAAAPRDPDDQAGWPKYEQLLAHIEPSAVIDCPAAEVRQFCRNMVRYLYVTGNHAAGLAFADRAIEQWGGAAADEPDVLIMRGWQSSLLRELGRYQEAMTLSEDVRDRMTRLVALGPEHEETLIVLNGYGADLRVAGRFAEARELDRDLLEKTKAVFGESHRRVFKVANNIAVDAALAGDYMAAHKADLQNLQETRDFFGRDDDLEVMRTRGAIARDLREGGDYREAARAARLTRDTYSDLVREGVLTSDHPQVLAQAKDFAITKRKLGDFAEALAMAEDVYDRYRLRLGEDHHYTFTAAITLANTERLADRPEQSAKRIEDVAGPYTAILGETHPFSYGMMLNLAAARRFRGELGLARDLLEKSTAGLTDRLSSEHHLTLMSTTNLAMVLAETGDLAGARELGERALAGFRRGLGEDHPHTLICAANLATDLRESEDPADRERAAELADDTLHRYARTLGSDHPDAMAAAQWRRLDYDFEPLPF
jgi:hypothetical protein